MVRPPLARVCVSNSRVAMHGAGRADVEDLCLDTVDELERGADNTTLACLASNAGALSPNCRAELTGLARVALMRYRMGMPLTSACDGDVMARYEGVWVVHGRRYICSVCQRFITSSKFSSPVCTLFHTKPNCYDGRCAVDKLSAPFLEKGYIQSCLVKHASRLHPPCWALISTMDDT